MSTNTEFVDNNEIWLVIDSLHYGGIESHVIELAQGLKAFDQPVRVILIFKYEKPAAIIGKLQKFAINFAYIEDLFKNISNNKNAMLWHKLAKIIHHYQPKVLHAHGYKASIYSKLCKLKLKNQSRYLTTFHAGETPIGKVRWYDRLDRYTAFICDANLCVSQAIQEKVPFSSLVLNNFITPPDNNKDTHCNKHIAFVGRLSHEKGPDRFITLAKRYTKKQFHLYGDGEMQAALKAQASNNVKFHGFQNMSKHWSNIELLLITSRFEGLPMAAIEAMARRIPIISLNVGAISSLVKHNHNGFIVRNINEMGKYLENWFTLSTTQQEKIRSNAYQSVKQEFSSEAIIPKVIELYGAAASYEPIS